MLQIDDDINIYNGCLAIVDRNTCIHGGAYGVGDLVIVGGASLQHPDGICDVSVTIYLHETHEVHTYKVSSCEISLLKEKYRTPKELDIQFMIDRHKRKFIQNDTTLWNLDITERKLMNGASL